jgi:hypothetical protein
MPALSHQRGQNRALKARMASLVLPGPAAWRRLAWGPICAEGGGIVCVCCSRVREEERVVGPATISTIDTCAWACSADEPPPGSPPSGRNSILVAVEEWRCIDAGFPLQQRSSLSLCAISAGCLHGRAAVSILIRYRAQSAIHRAITSCYHLHLLVLPECPGAPACHT